jgi:alpha-1,2-mannosyltransferase
MAAAPPITALSTAAPPAAAWRWLDRKWIGRGAALLLAIESAVLLFLVAGTHGWITPLERPTTTDFASFYAAGTLANHGTPQLAYDQAAHLAAEESVTEPGIEYQYFNYPPVYLMLCAALARLPYLAAFVLFVAASWSFYLLVVRRLLDDYSGTALLVLLAFPMGFWNIGLGQNAFLTAGLFGAATWLIDRRPIAAGLLFGLLCYKPHFGLLVPVALAAAGRWRSFAAAAASAGALILASVAWFGWETWQDFFATAAGAHAVYESGRILFAGFASPFGAVRLWGGSVALAYAVQAAAGLTAAALVVIVWRRGLSLATRGATLAAATLVAAPLALLYDLMLGTVAAAWLLRDDGKGGATPLEKTVLVGLYLLLLDARKLGETWHVPAAALAACGLFALVAARAARELAQRRPTST